CGDRGLEVQAAAAVAHAVVEVHRLRPQARVQPAAQRLLPGQVGAWQAAVGQVGVGEGVVGQLEVLDHGTGVPVPAVAEHAGGAAQVGDGDAGQAVAEV